MSVEISYRVIHLAELGPSVRMVLKEVRTVPPEEIERARREAEKEPELDIVKEGKLYQNLDVRSPEPKDPIRHMFWAMKQEFPDMANAFKNIPSFPGAPGGRRAMVAVPISPQIEVLFTPEQYRELGNPPLLSILKVSLKLESNAQKAESGV